MRASDPVFSGRAANCYSSHLSSPGCWGCVVAVGLMNRSDNGTRSTGKALRGHAIGPSTTTTDAVDASAVRSRACKDCWLSASRYVIRRGIGVSSGKELIDRYIQRALSVDREWALGECRFSRPPGAFQYDQSRSCSAFGCKPGRERSAKLRGSDSDDFPTGDGFHRSHRRRTGRTARMACGSYRGASRLSSGSGSGHIGRAAAKAIQVVAD